MVHLVWKTIKKKVETLDGEFKQKKLVLKTSTKFLPFLGQLK